MRSALRTGVARLLALLLLGMFLAAQPVQADSARMLKASIAAGKPTVLIVSRTPTAADRASEAYADFAGYLNDFAAAQRATLQFVTIKPAALKAIFAARAPIRQPFATVFIRNARSAVYYDGMIHDPIVYQAAAAYLAGRDSPDAASLGLKPFGFKLR